MSLNRHHHNNIIDLCDNKEYSSLKKNSNEVFELNPFWNILLNSFKYVKKFYSELLFESPFIHLLHVIKLLQ